MKPLILINFKVYPESTGEQGLKLAQRINSVKLSSNEIAIAPSLLMAQAVADRVSLPVFAQYADAVEVGAHTGSITAVELKRCGIEGVMLNHAEKRIPFSVLKKTVALCKKQRLRVLICAGSLGEIAKFIVLKPEFIAYEPKELIGGNISVTQAKPGVMAKAVVLAKGCRLLCGAGVHSAEDVRTALRLGATGVLLSHAVVKARNPKKFLKELLR